MALLGLAVLLTSASGLPQSQEGRTDPLVRSEAVSAVLLFPLHSTSRSLQTQQQRGAGIRRLSVCPPPTPMLPTGSLGSPVTAQPHGQDAGSGRAGVLNVRTHHLLGFCVIFPGRNCIDLYVPFLGRVVGKAVVMG